MLKHVEVEIWDILTKIHYFLERLLVFLQTVLQDAWFSHQDVRASFPAPQATSRSEPFPVLLRSEK
jgi:hypothetical protein